MMEPLICAGRNLNLVLLLNHGELLILKLLLSPLNRKGKQTGVLVNFGCHATTLTGNNWLYTADYPGYLAEAIKRVKGKDFKSLFCNGCCGNVTQVDYRIGFP